MEKPTWAARPSGDGAPGEQKLHVCSKYKADKSHRESLCVQVMVSGSIATHYIKEEAYRAGCSFRLGDGGIEGLMPRKRGCVLNHLVCQISSG